MRHLRLLSLPLLTLLACAADAPGSSSARAIALEDSCEALRGAVCAVYVGCGYVAPEHAEYCEAWAFDCEDFTLDRAVAAGQMAYDGAALRRCLANLETASCEEYGWAEVFEVDPDCRAAFHGVVPVGGACDDNLACASGQCDYECPGHCLATGAAGTACGPDLEPCAPYLGCVDGACAELPGAGEPCTQDTYDGYTYGRCGPGLVCDEDSDVCRAWAEEGEPCAVDDEGEYAGAPLPCAAPFRCEAGHCVAPGAEGDPCADGDECRLALRCVAGRCAPRLGEGESCGGPEGGRGCAIGLRCLSTGACGRPLPVGAACDDLRDDCREFCEDGICKMEVGPGQACDDVARLCYGPCVDGVCTEDCSGW